MDSASIGGYIQKSCIRVPNATEGYSEPIAYRVVDNNGNVSNIFGSLDSAKRYASEMGVLYRSMKSSTPDEACS